MVKKYLIAFAIICLVTAFAVNISAQEKAVEKATVKHEFIGVDKCKMCHKKDGVHPSWLETKHAKAWESLNAEQQKDANCVGCHSTGTTAAGELLTGVQCEACHGAGSDYKSKPVMENREEAVKMGLVIPDEKTCLGCHNEKVPEQFRSKEKFDFAKMKATGVHSMAVKEEAKEKTE
ncbi:MAG: multiheme c-type cytochrome [Candidatus Zixiibacteriota bacterium]